MQWTKSTYLGPHEWVTYDDMSFQTWDKWARRIMYEGYDKEVSFRGNRPKKYRYYNHDDGYRYWIVGMVLNRAKL